MKKVLVTGGAGFIGSNLALKLAKDGYQVVILDNLSPQIHGVDESTSYLYQQIRNIDNIEFIKGDVTKREDWLLALKGVQVIVHLAAETGTGQSMYEIERYTDVNVNGTAIMYDILANEKNTVEVNPKYWTKL